MYVPMTPGRAFASVVAMLPLIALWQLIPQPSELVGEQDVEGTIVEITRAEMRQKMGDSNVTRVAQVELPDGGRARVWLANRGLRAGDVIELRVRSFDDGHREVSPLY